MTRVHKGVATALLVCLFMALNAAPATAASIYTDQSTFIAALQPGYYLEDYSSYSHGDQGTTMNFSQGGFSYTAFAPLDLWINTAIGHALSTNALADPIAFTFTSGNVTAVGGYFYPSTVREQLTTGVVDLMLSDGTTYSLTNPDTASFAGFTTDGGVTIASMTVDVPSAWPTVDDLYVGYGGTTIPEPTTIALLGIGLYPL